MTADQLTLDCDPMWDLDDAVYIEASDRDLLGQGATARQIVTAASIEPRPEYL